MESDRTKFFVALIIRTSISVVSRRRQFISKTISEAFLYVDIFWDVDDLIAGACIIS